MKGLALAITIILLVVVEILRVYFIMPFPGSQKGGTLSTAYWLGNNMTWIRIVLYVSLAILLFISFRKFKGWQKAVVVSSLLLYVVVGYFFNFQFEADKMFYQPKVLSYSTSPNDKIKGDDLVLGVEINGEAKAFPIELLGYHHQVRDSIGNTPVMVTYCTVCRTGRVFKPIVDGKVEEFRLVGMDRFNAMFEDERTKSWWQQATGVAVAGPLKGKSLPEIPSQQMTLESWLRAFPNSSIMQPDSNFSKQYKGLAEYDQGGGKSNLVKRDPGSWQFKSWVIGVDQKGSARAYDWNQLVKNKLIQDSLPELPLVIALEDDGITYHVWNRDVRGTILQFTKGTAPGTLIDTNTQSTWNMNGICIDGELAGNRLTIIQAYQEFWHSWKTFHPNTTIFGIR